MQLNNWTYKYRYTIFNRVWAILLLAIFVNATLIETLHNHGFENVSSSIQKVEKASLHEQLLLPALKCKLCDLVKHRSHFYTLPAPTLPCLSLLKAEEKPVIFILGKSSAFVLLSSNKGPPSFIA
ncbi:hypothetical protein [Pedobacter jamesrossensis]|uniref:Uncharacterized protein n=1 Tax=Pedobacter jamesrossensis TaxID=1908238 RepID=A0ABV8NGP6_9SPHI